MLVFFEKKWREGERTPPSEPLATVSQSNVEAAAMEERALMREALKAKIEAKRDQREPRWFLVPRAATAPRSKASSSAEPKPKIIARRKERTGFAAMKDLQATHLRVVDP